MVQWYNGTFNLRHGGQLILYNYRIFILVRKCESAILNNALQFNI